MNMNDYQKLAEQIPEDWMDEEEFMEECHQRFGRIIASIAGEEGIVLRSEKDMDKLFQIKAKEFDLTVEETKMELNSVITTNAKFELFTRHYGHLLPRTEDGKFLLPTPFLCKILKKSFFEITSQIIEGEKEGRYVEGVDFYSEKESNSQTVN